MLKTCEISTICPPPTLVKVNTETLDHSLCDSQWSYLRSVGAITDVPAETEMDLRKRKTDSSCRPKTVTSVPFFFHWGRSEQLTDANNNHLSNKLLGAQTAGFCSVKHQQRNNNRVRLWWEESHRQKENVDGGFVSLSKFCEIKTVHHQLNGHSESAPWMTEGFRDASLIYFSRTVISWRTIFIS